MNRNIFVYIFVMAIVSYVIRVLPMTLIRKPIKNVFVKSFLYYVPYITLAVMTFPAIIEATQSYISGSLVLICGTVAARFRASLFQVAVICCVVVFLCELIII